MACIETPQFILQYEGQSLGPEIDTPPNVPVDGRNARIDALWRTIVSSCQHERPRPWFTYSQRDRTLTFEYANKRFVYSDPTRRLSVDGRAYSTANGPITLLVKRDGTIVEQESTTSSAK